MQPARDWRAAGPPGAAAGAGTGQGAEAEPKGSFRRKATWVGFLTGRDGGGLAHRRRQTQQPLVAEGLSAVRLLGLA